MHDMENLQSSLPGWEIVRCIGSGSSGKVYELKKKDEYGGDFHCALKVISVPGSQKEYDEMLETMSEFAMRAKLREKVEEISNEYRLLGALRGHPNVVNCEDQMIIPHENDMGWDIYIRMELLQSLPDYVRENGMTVENVIKLGSDMCSALELCRENNIIHRDIKPQNIFGVVLKFLTTVRGSPMLNPLTAKSLFLGSFSHSMSNFSSLVGWLVES